jgi:hypothetical protein
MRAFTLAVLAAMGLAVAPVTASAATIVEGFAVDIVGPTSFEIFASLPGFDPTLGTLLGVSVSLSGLVTWTPVGALSGLSVMLDRNDGVAVASQEFGSSTADPQAISISLNAMFDPETQAVEFLSIEFPFDDGSLSDLLPGTTGTLEGAATYTFTPTPVPEPSTWAMMLLGFGGVGYAAFRRCVAT